MKNRNTDADDIRSETPQPHNVELEQALLADIIALGEPAYRASAQLGVTRRTFYIERHQWVWEAFRAVDGKIDLLTVKAVLERAGKMADIGGLDYLKTILTASPRYHNHAVHAEELRKLETRRQYLGIASALAEDALRAGISPLQIYQRHDKRLHGISTGARNTIAASTLFSEEIDDYSARARAHEAGQSQSLNLGLPELIGFFDNEFNTGTYSIMMGPSGIGKSWMVLQMALAISEDTPVLIWELEMIKSRVRQRMGAMQAQVPYGRVKKGTLDSPQTQAYMEAMNTLSQRPLEVVTGHEPIAKIKHAVMEMQDRYGKPAFLIVDTLNNLGSHGGGKYYEDITKASAALLDIKVSTEAGVLAVAQQRMDFDPSLSLDNLYKKLRPNPDNIQNAKTLFQHVDWLAALYSSEHWARYRQGYNDPDCPTGFTRLYSIKGREQEDTPKTLIHWDRNVPIYRSRRDPMYAQKPAHQPANGKRPADDIDIPERKVYGQGD